MAVPKIIMIIICTLEQGLDIVPASTLLVRLYVFLEIVLKIIKGGVFVILVAIVLVIILLLLLVAVSILMDLAVVKVFIKLVVCE